MSYAFNGYSKLPPPHWEELSLFDKLDEKAFKEENAKEFLRFDLAILQLSGAQDQLEAYAVTQENLAQDREQSVGEEDPIFTQIHDRVKNQVNNVGLRVKMPLFLP